jgi:RHS repeat-associated protein
MSASVSNDCSTTSNASSSVNASEEDGKVKTYTYDALNRQVSYTNETGDVNTYGYDANSNLVSNTRTDGSIVNYEYDARKLLTSVDYPGDAEDVVYTYDSLGRKVSEQKGAQQPTVYEYDALNRIVSQGKTGSKVSYDYDVMGNRTMMTYPSGRVVEYEHDDTMNTTSMSTAGVGAISIDYNKQNQVSVVTLPNQVQELGGYDAAGKQTGAELKKNSVSLYSRDYGYNDASEIVKKTVELDGSVVSTDNLEYDLRSKLLTQKYGTGSAVNGYDYSATGNLTAVNDADQVYDNSGKLTSSGDDTFAYDDRGNRTAVTNSVDSTQNRSYSWNQSNLLTEVITPEEDGPGSTTTKYEYGAGNLLEKRTENGQKDEFIWDMNRAIPVLLSDGDYEYVYKSDTDRVPVAQVELDTGDTEFLHTDLNGSVVASTDTEGIVTGTVDYSPYGEPTGALVSRFGYAGEWVDDTTGHSFLRARWLDTETGTFLSEDPLVQMTNNAYGYTEGNPLSQIDPLGLFPALIGPALSSSWWRGNIKSAAEYITSDEGIIMLGDISTVTGGIASALAITSMFVPAVAPVATVFGEISVVTGGAATIMNCVNKNTGSCVSGVISTTLSAIPVAGPWMKKLNQLGFDAGTRLPKTILPKSRNNFDIEKIDTSIMSKRFSYSGIQSAGLSADVFGRIAIGAHSKSSKGEEEC